MKKWVFPIVDKKKSQSKLLPTHITTANKKPNFLKAKNNDPSPHRISPTRISIGMKLASSATNVAFL